MTLSTKIGLSVFLGLLAILGVVGYIGLHAVWQSTDRTMDERLVLARFVAQDVDQDISQRLQQLQQIAPAMAENLEGNRLQPIKDALEEFYRYGGPYTLNTFLLDEQARTIWTVPSAPEGTALAYYPNVLESIRGGRPAVSGAISSPGQDGFMVSLSVPVRSAQGDTLGVLGTTFGPASAFLQTLLAPIHLGETGYAQVINERGSVMAESDSGLESSAFQVTAHAEHFSELLEEGQGGVWTCHRCREPEGEGDRRQDVMAFAPLTIAPWGVAIRQDEDEAFAPRNDLQRRFLISGSVALGLALGAALLVGRTLSRPLRQLSLASQRIAAGDLDEPVTVDGRDEIGQLGTAFELMRGRLKQSRRELGENSKTLATLEERERIAREMHDSLSQVLSYIRLTTSAIEEHMAGDDLTAAGDKLKEVRQAARDAYEDVRQGILALRAGDVLEKGLLPTLQEFLDHYRPEAGLAVELAVPDGEAVGLSQAGQVQLLRVIQEALANVRKHALAKTVKIEFSHSDEWLQVSVGSSWRTFSTRFSSTRVPILCRLLAVITTYYQVKESPCQAASSSGVLSLSLERPRTEPPLSWPDLIIFQTASFGMCMTAIQEPFLTILPSRLRSSKSV